MILLCNKLEKKINYQSFIQVQVIPWVLSDSNFMRSASQKLDPSKTVFVGGLHGMINAGKYD